MSRSVRYPLALKIGAVTGCISSLANSMLPRRPRVSVRKK